MTCLDISFQQGNYSSPQHPSKGISVVRARTCGNLGSSLFSATSFHITWVQSLCLLLLQPHNSEITLILTSCSQACVSKGSVDNQEVLGSPGTWGCTAFLRCNWLSSQVSGKGDNYSKTPLKPLHWFVSFLLLLAEALQASPTELGRHQALIHSLKNDILLLDIFHVTPFEEPMEVFPFIQQYTAPSHWSWFKYLLFNSILHF